MFLKIRDFESELASGNLNHSDAYLAKLAAKFFLYPNFYKTVKGVSHSKKAGRSGFVRLDWEEFLPLVGYDYDENVEAYEAKKFKPLATELIKSLSQFKLNFSEEFASNLEKLANYIGFSTQEKKVLEFFCILNMNDKFSILTGQLGGLDKKSVIQFISYLFDMEISELNYCFSRKSTLFKSGLLKVDSNINYLLKQKVDLIQGLVDVINNEADSILDLLRCYFLVSNKAELSIENFSYLATETQLLVNFLNSKSTKNNSLNVLVYGEPGTGKTQWVKAISNHLDKSLYEISNEDDDGDALTGVNRLSAFKLAQNVLSNKTKKGKDALILFDEIEDVFPSRLLNLFSSRGENPEGKAWMNKLLEESTVPTFWVSNDINQIDNAYIRRFDLVVEVKSPPREVRQQIISSKVEELPVSEKWISEVSKHKTLVPAIIHKAAQFVKHAVRSDKHQDVESHLLDVINRTLKAQGKKEIRLNNMTVELNYSTEYLNTDIDINSLVTGIKQSNQGRFCLYGLPGTGKTAFGKHLSEELDKPLILKKASDLLSPYVGEAEKNIAIAFEEAMDESAVLQIDEADTFLQNREKAQRSWEVSQVNELLTQMEHFNGVFIASTNLMDNIDSAAMRRFDLKIEFKPLEFQQAWSLLSELQSKLGVKALPDESVIEQLRALTLLTPGDFSTIARKLRFSQVGPSISNIVALLEQECKFKPNYRKPEGIGFLSNIH